MAAMVNLHEQNRRGSKIQIMHVLIVLLSLLFTEFLFHTDCGLVALLQ